VLIVSCFKYFVIILCQIGDGRNAFTSLDVDSYSIVELTLCLSTIIFGSIYDNTKEHKKITVIFEGILMCMLTFYAVLELCLIKILNFDLTEKAIFDLEFKFQVSFTVLGPAITLLIYLQLFNWFSKK